MEKFKEKFSLSGGSLFTYYFCFYMAVAPFVCFISSYYNDIGLTSSQIGVLGGIGPLITIIGQFVWGRLADRAYYKNTVLLIATLSTGVALYVFTLGKSYPFLFIMNIIYCFVNCSVIQLSDSIALEYCTANNLRFARARMGGSIGYAICNVIVGFLLVGQTQKVFLLNIIFILISVVSLYFVPKVRGSLSERKRGGYMKLFKDKRLVILLIFNFLLYLGYFFNMSFYGVMLRQYGATNLHIGIAQALSAICEVPFLLNSQKIIDKIGIKLTLILSACTFALRWILCGTVLDIWPIVFVASLHGVGHIVISYCTASYINKTVEQSLRASGQTLLGMVNYGFSKCAATLLGGIAADAIGINNVYIIMAVIAVISAVFLSFFLPKIQKL